MIPFLITVLFILSAFLVMIVLLQRGRGGGLAGAFGSGGGSSSAFGTKTGDVFTTVTVVAMIVFMILSLFLFTKMKWASTPDQIPGKPAKDEFTLVTDTSLVLHWKDDSSNRLGYHIYRAEDPRLMPAAKLLANVGPKDSSYADNALTPGTTYYYRVAVWNNAGEKYDPDFLFSTKTLGTKPVIDPATILTMPETAASKPATTSAPAVTTTTSAPAASPTSAPTPPASAPATTTKP